MNVSALQQTHGVASPSPATRRAKAAHAEPQDSFQRMPSEMTPQQLRQATQASMQAERQDKRPAVEIKKIPFGVEIEMENFDLNQAKPMVTGLPAWNVHPQIKNWKMVVDQSLSSKTGGEAVSPVMTLEDGVAEKQIRGVVAELVRLGGKTTKNCGLHIHVDSTVLGEKGLNHLMMMVLEQEHALFRLSQNGNPVHRGTLQGHGFRHNTPYYYGKPLSYALGDPFGLIHAASPNEFRNVLYGAIPADGKHARPALPSVESNDFRPHHRDAVRYFGVNFNAYWYQGTIEFRLFDGTQDADQVMENVNLVLGMVAAAANGDYAYMKTNPLGTHENVPVSKEAFEYLLDKVAKTPALKTRLRDTFIKSGGILADDAPVKDPQAVQAAFLLEQGYAFNVDGRRVHSPMELADIIREGKRQVTTTPPRGEATPLAGKTALEALARGTERKLNEKKIAALDSADRALVDDSNALIDHGFSFKRGTVLEKDSIALMDAVLSGSAGLKLRLPSTRTAWPVDRTTIGQIADVALGRDERLDPSLRSRLAAFDALFKSGGMLWSPDGKEKIESRAAAVLHPDQPFLFQPAGSNSKLALSEAVLSNLRAHFEGQASALDPLVRSGVERASALQARGFAVTGEASHPAVLVAELASGRGATLKDLLGNERPVDDAQGFVDMLGTQLQALEVPAEHRAAYDTFNSLIARGDAVARHGGELPVMSADQTTWLLGTHVGVNIVGGRELGAAQNEATPKWSVPVSGWQAMSDFVRAETDPQAHPSQAAPLQLIHDIRKAGSQFYYVARPAEKAKAVGVPVTLSSTVLHQLEGEGVKVELPRWVLWRGLPRKKFHIQGAAALNEVARKLGLPQQSPSTEPAAAAQTAA